MNIKKIYHIADVHIRNVKRHKEYRLVFEKMFEEIRKRGTKDSLIYLAGDITHAKLEMSPELVKEISWLFTQCSQHATTILIAGNHDCNMNNSDRLDALTPIVDALNLPNFHYLKDTQIYEIGNVGFSVFSIFDKRENWLGVDKFSPNIKTKIALFHGPVDASQTDIGYVVSSRHFTNDMFDGFDLALLGDIHKRQEMISPKGCKVVYAGSLIQQNFGESLDKHGLLVWDLDTLTYEEIDIQNDYGYYTLNVDGGVVPNVSDIPIHCRIRVRFSNTDAVGVKQAVTDIKLKYGISDFTIIHTDTISKLKTGNRNNKLDFDDVSDINYQNTLITDYVERMLPQVTNNEYKELERINADINSRLIQSEQLRNINWKPIKFQFSNMFSYGEGNEIDFSNLSGLMGLFAANASGKSSLFDAVSFCLYDKCSRAFKAQHIMNNKKDWFQCKLHLQIEGVDYFIQRDAKVVNKGKSVKVDVDFWKEEDGIKVSLNGTERRDTDHIISQYVGTYDDFILTALSLQSNNALFIDKSQSERKDVLAKFMGLDIFDKLYETAVDDSREMVALIRNFKRTDFTTELAEKTNELIHKEEVLKSLQTESEILTTQREEIQTQISELNKSIIPIDKNLDIVNLNNTKNNIERNYELITQQINKKESTILENQNLLSEVSQSAVNYAIINGKDIKEAKIDLDLHTNSLSEIQRKYELLYESLKSNMEKLLHLEKHEYDPNCKFCMNNVFVKDAISTKEIVNTQNKELELLESQQQSLIKQLDMYSDVEVYWSNYTNYNTTYQRGVIVLDKDSAELNSLRHKKELIESELKIVEESIKKYYENEEAISNNNQIEIKISQLNKEKAKVDLEFKSFNDKIMKVSGDIGSVTTFIESTQQKMKQIEDLEEKHKLYTYYMDAVKRDGVPYELITKALPVIESEVNNILNQVVDFSIVLETDGKNINSNIVYNDQSWALEMGSGMEKFISGLAIRVALINICNLPRPNFLVIDEGFGTLDADNLSSLFMMMQYLKTQFDFLWVISHLEQMRDIVDGLIEIQKVNGFSKIKI
jgi:DNA repair exonuclease SbcCD ATPase subunit